MGWLLISLGILLLIATFSESSPEKLLRHKKKSRLFALILLWIGLAFMGPSQPTDPPATMRDNNAGVESFGTPTSAADIQAILAEIDEIDAMFSRAVSQRDPGRAAREQRMHPTDVLAATLTREDLALHNRATARAKALEARVNNISGVLLPEHPVFYCRRAAIYLEVGKTQEWMALEGHDTRYAGFAADHLREYQQFLNACRQAAWRTR